MLGATYEVDLKLKISKLFGKKQIKLFLIIKIINKINNFIIFNNKTN